MSEINFSTLSISKQNFIEKTDGQLNSHGKVKLKQNTNDAFQSLQLYSEYLKSNFPKSQWLLKKRFLLKNTHEINSWKFNTSYYSLVKKGGLPPEVDSAILSGLPPFPRKMLANNIFTSDGKVVFRDFDKFFSASDLTEAQWMGLEVETAGPYDIAVKENGTSVLISQFPELGLLISANYQLSEADPDNKRAETWLDWHLEKARKQKQELANFLQYFKVTLVCSMCNNEVEEKILPYPDEGLVLVGINTNASELETWPKMLVEQVALYFGLNKPSYQTKPTLSQVRKYLQSTNGYFEGRAIDSLVISSATSRSVLFEVPLDYPRNMFLVWHKFTLHALKSASKRKIEQKGNRLTLEFMKWVLAQIQQEYLSDELRSYSNEKGISRIRQEFFSSTGLDPTDASQLEFPTGKYKGVLIVPVGGGEEARGFGSTLSRLTPCVCISRSDNVSPASFRSKIVRQLAETPIAYVDDSNQLSSQRKALLAAVLTSCPDTAILSISWIPSSNDLDSFAKKAFGGYKTLTFLGVPAMKTEHAILFLKGIEHVDRQLYPSDANFSHNFKTDGFLPTLVRNILPVIKPFLDSELDPEDFELTCSLSPRRKISIPYFYTGIKLGADLFTLIYAKLHLEADLNDVRVNEAKSFLKALRPFIQCSIPTDFHVTLTHNNSPVMNNAYLPDGAAHHWLNEAVVVEFGHIVWQNNGIMAAFVTCIKSLFDPDKVFQLTSLLEKAGSSLLTKNKYLHTTVGVIDKQMKPSDSNSLLESYFGKGDAKWTPKSIALIPPISVLGRIQFFSTGPPKTFK